MGKTECSIEGGIATITFTNPPKGFFTTAMVEQLDQILDQIEADESVRAIVFTGGLEDVFIRHFSVEEIIGMAEALRERRKKGLPDPRFARTPLRLVWERIDNLQIPTIAAINGTTGGGGCELTLCCDIRVAKEGDYTIGQMEILVGLLPGAGGTTRLGRAVGRGKALEWVLRGRTFTPQEAYDEGLIHHLVKDDVVGIARDIATEFLDKPRTALSYIKQVFRNDQGNKTYESCDEEGDLFGQLIAIDDRCIEMMKEYVEGGHKLKKI